MMNFTAVKSFMMMMLWLIFVGWLIGCVVLFDDILRLILLEYDIMKKKEMLCFEFLWKKMDNHC